MTEREIEQHEYMYHEYIHETNICVYKHICIYTCICIHIPLVMCGCESWTVKKAEC